MSASLHNGEVGNAYINTNTKHTHTHTLMDTEEALLCKFGHLKEVQFKALFQVTECCL